MAVTYAYDGEGNRVAQHVVSFGSYWTTAYLLGDTAETTEGSGTFTDYLVVPGVGTAVETNSPSSPALSYLVTDGLQSVSVALDAQGNVSGQVLYFPYGGARYVTGRFPTTHGFTGQDEDGNTTGLYYDHARYYDPTIGQFAQADTYDAGGLNRFAYVDDNPASRTDPTGHCWLVCAVIAAVATAVVVTAVDAAVQYATTGKVDVGAALKTGATAGLMVGAAIALGPAAAAVEGTIAGGLGGGAVASVAAAAAVGAGEGAAFQVGDNVVNGRDWREGVGQAALIGGVSAGALSGAGEALGALRALRAAGEDAGDAASAASAASAAGDNAAEFCGLSFAAGTPVATPGGGERAISSLRVGDAVQAYDPHTGTTSTQRVQQVFVNHDTDLLDVTLRTSVSHAKPAAPLANLSRGGHVQQNQPAQQYGQQRVSPDAQDQPTETETIHTTANHPWLTADKGWEQAGVLRVGEAVVTAGGASALVVALHVVPGAAAMWDLTVSNVHTFAVGASQFVVHNCAGVPRYQGPKPGYEVDPEHVQGPHFNFHKAPLPPDAEAVYSHAVPGDPLNPRAWYGMNDNGDIYRYWGSPKVHFSGSTGWGSPAGDPPLYLNQIPRYARLRLGVI